MKKKEVPFFCVQCKGYLSEDTNSVECTMHHTTKYFEKGERIASQGNKVFHLLVLIRGKVQTEITSSSGLTLLVEQISAPSPLAAAFLFAEKNRFPVNVTALEACEVIFISKQTVEQQIAHCPNFMRAFMAFNANRIQYLSERLKLFAQKGIKAKLAYHILSLEENGKFQLSQSVNALANYFGVERPSLSRAISEMIRDGIISYKFGKGEILDFKAIENLLIR